MLLNESSAARSLLLCLFFSIVFSPAPVSSATLDGEGAFSLEVDEGERISLEANGASLKAILAQLSEAINLPIRALVDDTARVTVSFLDLPLEEAMQRLSNRVVYVHDPKSGAIDRIVVLPEGEQPAPGTLDTAKAAEPQPFKFEFDPSQAIEE